MNYKFYLNKFLFIFSINDYSNQFSSQFKNNRSMSLNNTKDTIHISEIKSPLTISKSIGPNDKTQVSEIKKIKIDNKIIKKNNFRELPLLTAKLEENNKQIYLKILVPSINILMLIFILKTENIEKLSETLEVDVHRFTYFFGGLLLPTLINVFVSTPIWLNIIISLSSPLTILIYNKSENDVLPMKLENNIIIYLLSSLYTYLCLHISSTKSHTLSEKSKKILRNEEEILGDLETKSIALAI